MTLVCLGQNAMALRPFQHAPLLLLPPSQQFWLLLMCPVKVGHTNIQPWHGHGHGHDKKKKFYTFLWTWKKVEISRVILNTIPRMKLKCWEFKHLNLLRLERAHDEWVMENARVVLFVCLSFLLSPSPEGAELSCLIKSHCNIDFYISTFIYIYIIRIKIKILDPLIIFLLIPAPNPLLYFWFRD